MTVLLGFYDEEENHLFTALAVVVPQAGDKVCYSMEAVDREEWNEEAWNDKHAISGKEWTVLRVYHEFRRTSIKGPEHHGLFVYVKPFIENSQVLPTS